MKMDALKFIEERNRMCKRYWQVDGDCDGCPMVNVAECNELRNMVDDAGKAIGEVAETVEKWSLENPRKTRQSVFLEQWPEAELTKDGTISICPIAVSAAYRNKTGGCASTTRPQCAVCQREFWMQEVE